MSEELIPPEHQDAVSFFQGEPKVQGVGKPCLVVVEHVYHLKPGSPASTATFTSEGTVNSNEDTWRRTQKVGEKPVSVSLGWLEEEGNCPGMLVLENKPERKPGNPTDEQASEDAKKVVLVGFDCPDDCLDACIEVPPGESCRFRALPEKTVWMKCAHGETRINIFCVPR